MLFRKIGKIKYKEFISDFDSIYDEYSNKSKSLGLGNLKFKKEKGKIIIFAKLNNED